MGHGNKATSKRSFKTLARMQPPDSSARVILHGTWALQRGRNPSMWYRGIQNANRAFDGALKDLLAERPNMRRTVEGLRAEFDPWYQATLEMHGVDCSGPDDSEPSDTGAGDGLSGDDELHLLFGDGVLREDDFPS